MNINPAAIDFIAAAGRAASATASVSATVIAAPTAIEAPDAAAADAGVAAAPAAAALDAAVAAAEELFHVPNLPPFPRLNAGDIVGDTVTIHGLQIEGILNVSNDVRRHAIAFYNDLIPQADGAGESYKLVLRVKHDRILHALFRVRNGERLSDRKSVV